MRITHVLCAALLVALAWGTRAAAGENVPAPDFDRVDHSRPKMLLELPRTLGKRSTIEKAAKEIEGGSAREKLASIRAWVDAHLKYDAEAAYAWRDFDRILADGTYGGCADHALVFGAIARGCGIPTVWVKTMDADWIRTYRRTHDENRTWSGHVFLEVHLDGRWALLDATQGILHQDYDVRQRILPGERFAYDKGGDPYELVLSVRWEEWKQQTREHFAEFDLAQLPVPKGAPLRPSVFVAGNNPEWGWAAERCRALGLQTGRSGNAGFEQWMPEAKGQILLVTCLAGSTVLPRPWAELLPASELEKARRESASGVVKSTAADGTRVVVVFADDRDGLRSEIASLEVAR